MNGEGEYSDVGVEYAPLPLYSDIFYGDFTSVYSFEWFANFFIPDIFIPKFDIPIDRRDLPAVPVGTPVFLEEKPFERDELSDLVIAESPGGTPQVSGESVMLVAVDWFDYWDRKNRGEDVLPPELYDEKTQESLRKADDFLLTPVGDIEVEDVTDFFDDLGDIVIGMAGQWAQGRAAPPEMGYDSPPPSWPDISSGAVPSPSAATAAACDTGPSPVYKKVCGVYKWVYPKRRRRRRLLLTDSDYNALLKIESLKVNKNMTVAIAKAITR